MSHKHHIETAEHSLQAEPSERLARPFQRFAKLSCSGGVVLLLMTITAMIWANSKYAHTYEQIFHDTLFELIVESDPHHGPGHAPAEGAEPNAYAETEHDGTTMVPGSTYVSAMDGQISLPPVDDHAGDHAGDHPDDHPGDHVADDHTDDGHASAANGHHAGPPVAEGQKRYLFLGHGLSHWINDLLMAVFFLVVGLEIKREILVGELASPKRAALPIFAALGGMIAPAAIFAAFNWGNAAAMPGWGVPMATDIAFAVGVMAMLGRRVPNSLKVFLLSLAIVDDLGALIVIAVFYTAEPQFVYLGYAFGVVGVLMAMNKLRVRWITPYLVLGLPLWYFVFMSGVHATIAGVLLAMTIPAHARVNPVNFAYSTRRALELFEEAEDDPDTHISQSAVRQAAVYAMIKNAKFVLPPLLRMETTLHPWAAFLIIPVFALANAGIPVHGGVGEAVSGSVSLGVIAGLCVGKPLGITLAALIAVKLGIASLPRGVTWRHIAGAGMLGGIGFTMAIFIANLAYDTDPVNLEHAKLAILVASTISAVGGAVILATCRSAPEPEPEQIGPKVGDYHGLAGTP
jgi:NhaA family Na+:H+ antiporter